MPARTPGTPQNRPEMGAPGPPDILGLSSEIIGFRNRGGGPVGHPHGVQVKTLILNVKCLPKGHHESEYRSSVGKSYTKDKKTRLALETFESLGSVATPPVITTMGSMSF